MAEQRLIDVGENSICDGCNWEACEGSPSENNRCYAKRWIDEQPTVDAMPVIHAHWELVGEVSPYTGSFKCSACKFQDVLSYNCLVPFCWHCGARMDEKDGENDG